MSVLLLRLAGPLQSWGTSSHFSRRSTSPQPTKSAVLGMIAAAEGRRRTDPIEDLLDIRFGVRIDQPGQVLRDFHTVSRPEGALPTAGGGHRSRDTNLLTRRSYLSDAVFVVGLESEPERLRAIEHAMRHPRFHLYLGRRSCPPAVPLVLGIREDRLEEVLESEPWQAGPHWRRRFDEPAVQLEILVDAAGSDGTPTEGFQDAPVSFDPKSRAHSWRQVRRYTAVVPNPSADDSRPNRSGSHDPFELLS